MPTGSVSYSTLSRYAQCGYRFYLERVLRLPPQELPPAVRAAAREAAVLDPMTRGSIVHELLEVADLAGPSPDAAAVRERGAARDLELTEQEVADVLGFVGGGARQRRRRARPHRGGAAPRAVLHRGAGARARRAPLLNGVVDVLARTDGGDALVVDYKTDDLGGADPEAVTEELYAIQRRIYALAALRAGAPRVEVVHLYLEFRPARPASARYEAADAGRLEAEVAALAAPLLAGEFPVSERPHRELCATCPGRGGLCRWDDDMTLRPTEEAV